MSNCERQVKDLCDKLGFHAVMLGLLTWVENRVEYCGDKIYSAEDEYIPAVINRLREAQAAYIARYTTHA